MLKIGSISGIPFYLHWTWFVLMIIIGATGGWSLFFCFFLMFFFVTLHELGHCYAAKYYNVKVHSITLNFLGGAAAIRFRPEPKTELMVVLAGPMVNCILAPCFLLLASIVGIPDLSSLLITCGLINIIIGAFNLLIPVMPMDGGRVLRALLVMASNDYLWGTRIAVKTGQALAVALFILGLITGYYFCAAIFLFMALISQQEIEIATASITLYNVKREIANILDRPDIVEVPMEELIVALEEVEDEHLRKQLGLPELIPLLKSVECN